MKASISRFCLPFITAMAAFCAEAKGENLTLFATGSSNSIIVTLQTNETARVLHWSLNAPFTAGAGTSLALTLNGVATFITVNFTSPPSGNSSQNILSSAPPVIAGPATIQLTTSGTAICTLQITRQSDWFVPTSSVVIPADSNGPVTIILESSVDLLNWIPANPGTYGTTTSNRFFRVRAQR